MKRWVTWCPRGWECGKKGGHLCKKPTLEAAMDFLRNHLVTSVKHQEVEGFTDGDPDLQSLLEEATYEEWEVDEWEATDNAEVVADEEEADAGEELPRRGLRRPRSPMMHPSTKAAARPVIGAPSKLPRTGPAPSTRANLQETIAGAVAAGVAQALRPPAPPPEFGPGPSASARPSPMLRDIAMGSRGGAPNLGAAAAAAGPLDLSLRAAVGTSRGPRGIAIQAAEAANTAAEAGRQMATIAAKASKAFEWEASKLEAAQHAFMELAQQLPD